MIGRRGFLKVALGGAAALAAGATLTAGAQDFPDTPAPVVSFRHPTLATTSTDPVGVHLVLAMDTSGSMNDDEFQIELSATAQAINSRMVRHAIKYKGGENSVAISVLDFDGIAQVRIPWVDIRGDEINDQPYVPGNPAESSPAPDRLDFLANEIQTLSRRGSGGTTIEAALDLAKGLFLACPWETTEKRVIDLFGDGTSGTLTVQAKRDDLAAMGVTINGFAIVNDEPDLDRYFRENLVTRSVIRAPDGILSEYGRVWAVARNMPAINQNPAGLRSYFNEVAEGMKQKLSIEVASLQVYRRILVDLGEPLSRPVPLPARDFGRSLPVMRGE